MAFLQQMANEPVPGKEARAIANPQPVSNNFNPAQDVINTVPTPVVPAQVVNQPEPTMNVSPKFFDDVDKDEPAPTAPTEEEAAADTTVEEESDVTNPGADHFKKLRKSHAELKKSFAETAKVKEEIEKKLRQYETGEAVPDVLKQKDEEIVRLSRYEKLVNLKGSKEYRERFISPLEEAKSKLKEIFADYGVPKEDLDAVVSKAINTQKRPELNQFLSEHLGNDELGAMEAKSHVFKAWEVQRAAQAAEAEPAQALEAMQQESQAVEQVREQERRGRIVKTAESTWVETLTEIREEGKLVELIHKEDDPEFNKHYPDRLLPQAAKEYGKMVTELGKNGITDLPKPLAKAIAKMVLLAHASGVNAETRNRAMEQVDTLTQNLTRYHTQLRPPIGGGTSRGEGRGAAPAKPLTPEQEAYNITNSIISRR